MHDHHQQRRQRSISGRRSASSEAKESIWIKCRRYTILEQLGVRHRPRYLVFDHGSGCRRLLMRLPHNAPTRQHLRALRRLPQSNSVPHIIDTQIQGDEQLVVLSWVDGLDLNQYLQQVRQGRVVAPCVFESVRLIRGLLHGLLQMHHHAQLIHGDLKPANLILTRKPSFLAMIDYGSAWQAERSAFRHEGDGCERLYTAPELLEKSHVGDFRCDQFSVSVILYQLLTGVVPFDGLGGQAGLKRFQKDFDNKSSLPSCHSPAMRRLPQALRRELDQVVATGLRFDPDERYPTPSAWLDSIEAVFLKLKLRQQESDPSRWHRVVDWLAGLVPTPREACKEQP